MTKDSTEKIAKRIAIQGDKASFHDIAAIQIFGDKSDRVFCDTFADTFEALVGSKADYAVCAIENSLYGSINEVYDLLLVSKLEIVGEVYLRIEQCLVGLPNASISQINKVYSHPVALAQCEDYLNKTLPEAEREEYHDTAASVELVKKMANPQIAAIGSQEAADLHGLSVLAYSIEANKENYTRFVALYKSKNESTDNNKTSLILESNHSPGALYTALGVFAKRSINLSKLQSRPIIGKAWHYIFYVDLDIGAQDNSFKEALAELENMGCKAIVLGSYKAATKPSTTKD